MHPEGALSVHPRVYFFKVYFFVSCFPKMPLNRTELTYRNMKLRAYEKVIWMIELGAMYLLGPKVSVLVHPESVLGCTSCGAINEGLLSNKFFTRNQIKICGHAAKYIFKFYSKV